MAQPFAPPSAAYAPAGHIRIALDAGTHPASGQPVQAGVTCGSCVHVAQRTAGDGRPRTRCVLAVSRRGGPDVQPTYPGCDRHETAAAVE